MAAGTLALGAAMTNKSVGITAWITSSIAPILQKRFSYNADCIYYRMGFHPDECIIKYGYGYCGDCHCDTSL